VNILNKLRVGEIIYIFVGILFFVNAFVLSMGGDFKLLIITKVIYLVGLIFVVFDK